MRSADFRFEEHAFGTWSMMGPAIAMDGFMHFAYGKYPLLPCVVCSYICYRWMYVSVVEAALRGTLPFENWGFARYGGVFAD